MCIRDRFIGWGGAAALIGLQTLLQTISQHVITAHRSAPADFGSNFDAYLPLASTLGTSLLHSLLFTGTAALIASFIASQLRAPWLRILVFLLATLALMPNNWGSPADFVKQWLAELILLSVLVFGVRYVMRFNLLGCFLVLAITAPVSYTHLDVYKRQHFGGEGKKRHSSRGGSGVHCCFFYTIAGTLGRRGDGRAQPGCAPTGPTGRV